MGGHVDNPAMDEVQDQIEQQRDQLEQKRKSLYEQRIQIIKSQGGANWNPTQPDPYGIEPNPMPVPQPIGSPGTPAKGGASK